MPLLRLGERPSADVVVIILALMVGMTIIIGMLAIFVLEFLQPEYDTTEALETSNEIIAVIVGAVVGYVAGRPSAHTPETAPAATPAATATPAPAPAPLPPPPAPFQPAAPLDPQMTQQFPQYPPPGAHQ